MSGVIPPPLSMNGTSYVFVLSAFLVGIPCVLRGLSPVLLSYPNIYTSEFVEPRSLGMLTLHYS